MWSFFPRDIKQLPPSFLHSSVGRMDEDAAVCSRRRSKRLNLADRDKLYGGSEMDVGTSPQEVFVSRPVIPSSATTAALTSLRTSWRMSMIRLFRDHRTGPLLNLATLGVAYLSYVPAPWISTVRLYQRRTTAVNYRRVQSEVAEGEAVQDSPKLDAQTPRVNIYATGTVQPIQHSLVSATIAQGFLQSCHAAVALRRSEIHGRGLVATSDIPRGTRVVTAPALHFSDAPSYVKLVSDSRSRLVESTTYTHCSGVLNEIVLRGLPHHFINHSCEPNLRGGLCRALWHRAESCGNKTLEDFVRHDVLNFSDPNSLFATRDIKAGEELTVDYSYRSGPVYGGAPMMNHSVTCRCGSASCRGQIYRPREEVATLLKHKEAHGRSLSVEELLGLGFDDELAMIGMQSDDALLQWYLFGGNEDVSMTTNKKGTVVTTYRHVFKTLNSAAVSK